MLIERLRLRDFLVFFGDQALSFSFVAGKNLTLVLAPNNSGKTSIIRALEFLLYSEDDKARLEKMPNLARIKQLRPEATADCLVEATVREGAQRLTVTRRIVFSRVADEVPRVRIHDVQLSAVLHKDLTDETLQPGPDLEGTVSRLLPRVMFNFFFFKGEELTQRLLAQRAELRVLEELRRLLYQSEWESVLRTCADARAAVGRELAKVAQKEKEYRSVLGTLGDLSDSIRKQEAQLGSERQGYAAAEAQLAGIEAEIAGLAAASSPAAREQLQAVRAELDRLRQRKKDLDARRRELVGTGCVFSLASVQSKTVRHLLGDLHRKRLLPPDVSEALLVRLLEEGRCICWRDLPDGSTARSAVEELRKGCLSELVSNDLWTLDSLVQEGHMDGFGAKAQALVARLAEVRTEQQQVLDRELVLERQREGLEQSVDEAAAGTLRAKKGERVRLGSDLQQRKERIADLERTIAQNKDRSQRLQSELRRLEAVSSQAPILRLQAELCEEMAESAKRCHLGLTVLIRTELRRTVSDLYDGIVTDGSRARVSEKTLLPTIERSGIAGLAAGGGQEQTLVLCFLIALGKLRKTINTSLREHFSIKEFREQAFFMDSVFGQMQGEYRKGVAQLLPEHMTQLVLLVAGQQWDEFVESGVQGKITNAYGLELSTPKGVAEDEYQFSYGGNHVKLLVHLAQDAEAFTTIRKLG